MRTPLTQRAVRNCPFTETIDPFLNSDTRADFYPSHAQDLQDNQGKRCQIDRCVWELSGAGLTQLTEALASPRGNVLRELRLDNSNSRTDPPLPVPWEAAGPFRQFRAPSQCLKTWFYHPRLRTAFVKQAGAKMCPLVWAGARLIAKALLSQHCQLTTLGTTFESNCISMVDRNQGSTKLQHRAAALALNMCRFFTMHAAAAAAVAAAAGLSGNGIGDEGAAVLADALSCAAAACQLEHLDLSKNDLTHRGAASLAAAFKNRHDGAAIRCETLVLRGNAIGITLHSLLFVRFEFIITVPIRDWRSIPNGVIRTVLKSE
jgi:hypothetical protein